MPTLNQYNVNKNGGYLKFSIIENPLIEPLDGPLYIDHLMERFPETVYNRGRETHLYRFLTALAGDAGAGQLKKQSLFARMKYEGNLLSFEDLDGSYKTFGFSRLPNETYAINAKESSLTTEEWDAIHTADISYRRRIMDFYQATQYGSSPEGMRLAAKAGSGQEMIVSENYRAIFDSISDDPIGIEKNGNTDSLSEFIIQPAIQQNKNNLEYYATLSVVPPVDGNFYSSDSIVFSYNSELSVTIFLRNISSSIIKSTIVGFNAINTNDVNVEQMTSTSFKISFPNPDLSLVNLRIYGASLFSGAQTEITYSFIDSAFYSADFGRPRHEYYDAVISNLVATGGSLIDETTIWLDPAYERNMSDVIERLKPTSSIATVKSSEQREIEIPINSITATSEKFVVNRFIKGNLVQPVTIDDPINGYFIVPNEEREERTAPYSGYDISVISMTISNVIAYKGNAIDDQIYNTPKFYSELNNKTNNYISYRDGSFDPTSKSIFPFLSLAPSSLYSPERILPDYDTQAVVTTSVVV